MRHIGIILAAAGVAATLGASAALAQKSGGTLRIAHRDNPPSASIHEEATISVNMPFMAIYSNLVLFDPKERLNSADKLSGELATSWSWNDDKTQLTFKLREGVKWHDGKPFTSADVVCTFDALTGKAKGNTAMRKNPRQVWYKNLKETRANGPMEVTFVLERPQPSFMAMLASGYTPIYACHVSNADYRTKPIGTGPFKFVEFKRNESIKLVKNPDYFRKGQPYLDAIEWTIIANRSTRILSFVAGHVDMTFDSDVTFPTLPDLKKQVPSAICEARPTNVSTNLIVNSEAPPFDNPEIRKAMALALDRKAFSKILTEGNDLPGATMLPPPAGVWGMPAEELAKLPGYGDDLERNLATARAIMTKLGYSTAKPLKIKVATRNISIYSDPAVILIDQLKKIFIEGELDTVETPVWYPKVLKKDYQVGLNLTGAGVDDPDVQFYENFLCGSERNYTGYCNKEVDAMIDAQSREFDVEKRKRLVWALERKLTDEVARPIISWNVANTCLYPRLKGLVLQQNGIYNGWRFDDVWLDK